MRRRGEAETIDRRVPIIIGHRGASGYRPEHTREAFELAFALGADAVEPDLVASRDGELVIRHDIDLGDSTDVAELPEFAGRRRDGPQGWPVSDFTWSELCHLRARERLPLLRPLSASFDGRLPIVRLPELLELVDSASLRHRREFSLVIEIKDAAHHQAIGLPMDELLLRDLRAANWLARPSQLVIESFEPDVLYRLRDAGLAAKLVLLIGSVGAPADAPSQGSVRDYAWWLSEEGMAEAAGSFRGISVDKTRLLAPGGQELVARARDHGLEVFTWTLRPENVFLESRFRSPLGAVPTLDGTPPAVPTLDGTPPAVPTLDGPPHALPTLDGPPPNAVPTLDGASEAGAVYGDWLAEFVEVMRAGVTGVFADHPDLASFARERAFPHP